MQPLVTVVIPTRNRFELLREALASVRAQTFVDWQVVVVDDASDDGSAESAAQLLANDAKVTLVRLQARAERSTARNTGLTHAETRYVLFLDDDDRLCPTALEYLVAALEQKPEAVVGIGARRMFDERGHTRRAPHPRVRLERRLWRELLVGWVTEWVAVPGQCLFRTQTLRDSGGWNATLVGPEDQELLLRVAADRTAFLLPHPVLEYRLHGNQWRPPDVADQEAAFRHEIAALLAASGHQDAQRYVRAGGLLRQADHRYDTWDYAGTLRSLAVAARTAPDLLTSPILGPAFVHLLAKSIVGTIAGRRAARGIRNIRDDIRLALRRSPEANVVVLHDAGALPGRAEGYRAASTAAHETPD